MVVNHLVVVNDDVVHYMVLAMVAVMMYRAGERHRRAQDNGGKDDKGFHLRHFTVGRTGIHRKLAVS